MQGRNEKVSQPGLSDKERIFPLFEKRDYEGILSLGLVNLCLESGDGVSFFDIATDILRNCTGELKHRYPIAYMRLAYALFVCGRFDDYAQLLAEARQIAEASSDTRLIGEWYMISAYEVFPNIPAMTERYRCAAEYLDGESRVISPQEPYMFGCLSMWYLFHTRIGGADATADELSRMLATYTRLTGGHGAGADALYRGEVACMRGQFEHATRFAEEARALADASLQASVALGAALLQGRIAVVRSDVSAFNAVINYMDYMILSYNDMQGSAMNEYMAGMARSMLRSMLGKIEPDEEQKTAFSWLDRMPVPAMILTNYASVSGMILRHDYHKIIDALEFVLLFESRTCNLVARLYIRITLGVCYARLGNMERAAINIDKALEISGPDRFFISFIRFRRELAPIFNLPQIKRKHAESIARINVLEASSAAKGMLLNYFHLRGAMPDTLTGREREIAHLAASGLRNGEIAQRLYITEATVKGYMKSIFQKLDIDRRSKLAEMIR